MRHFERDGYHAVDWPARRELVLQDLWERFPSLVVGRFIVNTSFDSGFVMLSEEEKRAGWRMVGSFAHSPRITASRSIPRDQFDEWLVFDQPTTISSFETMVNYTGFSPVAFEWPEKWEQFWSQIRALQPLHVIGENDGVYLVTRDAALIREIEEANQALDPTRLMHLESGRTPSI
jgi:hypothetical protein